MLRYRISLIECGIDDPGERYGYQTQLTWGDDSWEDCVQFGLTEADARALVEWVKYSEECERCDECFSHGIPETGKPCGSCNRGGSFDMTIQEMETIMETGEIEECDCYRCVGVCSECWDEGEDNGCPVCGRFTEGDC